MSPYGWITLVLCVTFTTGSLVWCFLRVVHHHGRTDKLHSPTDLDLLKSDRPRQK
jgi:hypothetical protein